jgi:hypothetical protein
MPSFCTNCGSPIAGKFCTKCGAATQESAAPAQVPRAPVPTTPQSVPVQPSAARTGSGVKILLIVLGVFLFLGLLGVGGVVYVGYRAKQKIAQLKKDYGIENDSATGAAPTMRIFPPSQGSGCKLLEGQEAAGILGVAVDRVESEPGAPDGSVSCRYWVSAAERQRLMKEEIASSIRRMGEGNTNVDQAEIEKLIGGAAGAMIEANGDNKNADYAFSLQVWPKNGKQQWDRVETARTQTSGAMGTDAAAVAMQPVDGLGDRALELPAGHSIMVLKGDSFFLLGFQQFVPGREKTAALAKVVAGRM